MPALSIKIVCFPLFLKRLVQFDKTGGKQNAADNVGCPMYAGNQAAYCHKHSKRDKTAIRRKATFRILLSSCMTAVGMTLRTSSVVEDG